MSVGRNDPCPCNSGRKYKRCCLNKQRVLDDKESQLFDPRTEEEIIESLSTLQSRIDAEANADRRRSLQLSLAQVHQRRGEHHLAIELLNEAGCQKGAGELIRMHLMAISVAKLGRNAEAIDLYGRILSDSNFKNLQPAIRGGIFMELGKAHRNAENGEKARTAWTQASQIYHKIGESLDYARAQANLGMLRLHDPDLGSQEAGVKMMEDSCIIKAQHGDAEGLANTYCTLSLYYWRQKRYGRALAYMRLDLKYTKLIGDLHSLCITLCNLAALYIELRQFTNARKRLREAIEISEKLGDKRSTAIAEHNLTRLEDAARLAGLAGDPIGPKALCACGSNREYQDCCGRADYDPPDNLPISEISAEAKQLVKHFSGFGVEPTPLDFILRQSEKSKDRRSWTRILSKDGWYEIFELPDMANHYLRCARELCDRKETPDDIHTPLMAVIMCACALEAFINQVSYFLIDFQQSGRSWLPKLPEELESGALEFQRNTNLLVKWEILGNILCGSNWPIQSWQNAKIMITIRNELVHFKSAEYEQLLPEPRLDVEIMRQIPKEIQLRKAARAWPYRLLTHSFAIWALSCAESNIEMFKEAYLRFRLDMGSRPKTSSQ